MKTDHAWAAGIIDGEGHISFEFCRKNIRPIIEVYNTDYRILLKLKSLFDGYIVENKRNNRPNIKRCWLWRIRGKKAIYCLETIYQYLIAKSEKAKILIDYGPLIGEKNKRQEKQGFFKQLKEIRA